MVMKTADQQHLHEIPKGATNPHSTPLALPDPLSVPVLGSPKQLEKTKNIQVFLSLIGCTYNEKR